MTEDCTSAKVWGGIHQKTAPLRSFCFHCTWSFGNTLCLNCSVASLRAHRGRVRSAGACTKHNVQRCCRGPPAPGGAGGDGERYRGLPPDPPPGAHPGLQPSPRAGAAVGCRAPARYRRVELSTRRGVYSCAYFALLSERRTLGSGQRLQLQPAPLLPPPGALFLIFFFFFSSTPAAAASPRSRRRPLGGIPWQLPGPSASGGMMAGTPALQPSKAAARREQQDG